MGGVVEFVVIRRGISLSLSIYILRKKENGDEE